MKIGILTFHCAHNYGAVLQCYALQETLKQMGHEVEVIDYRPKYLTFPYKRFYWNRIFSRNPIKALKKCYVELLLLDKRFSRYKVFNKFINERLQLSEKVANNNIPSRYDIYIMGSDQIWNPKITKGFDSIYFGCFKFEKKKKKYISYAASMETKSLSTTEKDFYINVLRNFDAVSVREVQLAEQLHQLIGRDIETVLDPTLLASVTLWNQIALPPDVNYKYVLIYQIRRDPNARRIAENIAKQIGVKIIEVASVPTLHADKTILQGMSPEQFIGLIKNAECVVTTSFHGTAFSIVFQRPFYTLELGDDRDTRSQSLLESIGLKDRIIKKDNTPNFSLIDYENNIEMRLKELRKSSKSFLERNTLNL